VRGPAQPRRGRPTAIMRGPFGLLWAGQSVSLLGDTVFLIAFTWQLAVAWHRPGLLGVLLAARVAAELVTLGLGGWIVDWIARRDLIGAADAVRAGLLLGLALFLHQPPPVVPMAIILALFGVATALFRPALGAYIPQIVPPEHLQAANARLGLSQQAATLAGPAIGAGLVAVGSASTALRLDALSFALAAISALFLPRRAPAAHGGGGALAATLEGFRVVRRAWWLGGGILLASLVNIATITAERLALPQVANQRYGHLGGYATILFTISVGAIVTNLVMDRLRPPGRAGSSTPPYWHSGARSPRSGSALAWPPPGWSAWRSVPPSSSSGCCGPPGCNATSRTGCWAASTPSMISARSCSCRCRSHWAAWSFRRSARHGCSSVPA